LRSTHCTGSGWHNVAKYFAILLAMLAFTYASAPGERGPLEDLNLMNLGTPQSAIIFNALIIPVLPQPETAAPGR
jgi:K+-transporting ATPase ATPase B chain